MSFLRMLVKLGFHITHVSGQDDDYKASELNEHKPFCRGWRSHKYCLYPQDLILQLDQRSSIRKIQLLSHESITATKIEFFVGDVPEGQPFELENAKYTRLGYVALSDNEKTGHKARELKYVALSDNEKTGHKARELKYVALSDNEKTGHKARELKSVQVDAVGVFLKLIIHKNHINPRNLHNQVSLIAINLIGDKVRGRYEDITDFPGTHRSYDKDPEIEIMKRPDYISPMDDLAFDMYQDPEMAKIIRQLEKKKYETVAQERYELAKQLKNTIEELKKAGERLGKYEVDKRNAIEKEDYDTANLMKNRMDEYRLNIMKQLRIPELLDMDGPKTYRKDDYESSRQPSPPRMLDPPYSRRTPSPPPKVPYDDRPLPAIKSQRSLSPPSPHPRTPYDERPLPIHNKEFPSTEESTSPKPSYDERPLPVARNKYSELEREVVTDRGPSVQEIDDDQAPPPDTAGGSGGGAITGEPEPMTEKDMREASAAIDVFGEPLVSKAYSKTWSYREDALLAVYKQMQDLPAGTHKDEAKSMLRAATFLIKRAIEDKVYAVFKAGLMLLKMILTEYCPKHRIPKADTITCVERTMVNLLHKSGDTAVRNRDDAKNFIYEEAQFPEVKPTMTVPHECVKPWKGNIAPRLAQSRTEIVEALYEQLGIKDAKSGLTVDNLMNFCVLALEHTSADVRTPAERIVKALYKEVGQPVKDYLPPDDEKTRKNTKWKLLFEYFDKVDGKPSKSDVKRQRAEEEARKQQEIEGLQRQLQQLKDMASGKARAEEEARKQQEIEGLQRQLQQLTDMASGKAPVDENALNAEPKKPAARKNTKLRSNLPVQKNEPDDDTSVLALDNICIFCGEKNASFTEEGLDLHYWKNCPMLKRCANCKQVVEIASYTDHLLTECEAKANYAKCNRCTEAIPKAEYDQHIAEKSCNASKAGLNHCPLCHQNIPSGEDGWKNHLMGKDGCKQNPRRLLALNKQPAQGKSVGDAGRRKAGRGGKTPR